MRLFYMQGLMQRVGLFINFLDSNNIRTYKEDQEETLQIPDLVKASAVLIVHLQSWIE